MVRDVSASMICGEEAEQCDSTVSPAGPRISQPKYGTETLPPLANVAATTAICSGVNR